jgi:hypothetical protein
VWLLDPTQTQANIATPEREPWIGELYASFGHGTERSWDEATRYCFISAGGGAWYRNTLNLLNVGDRIWVKAPGYGFVGVGRVKGRAVPAADYMIATPEGDKPALEVLKEGNYHRQFVDDPEKTEIFVPLTWLQTVPLDQAVQEDVWQPEYGLQANDAQVAFHSRSAETAVS